MTDAEERKRRQEKFRKRKKSIFRKVKLLAQDTDAWVSLVVRDRVGQTQSFASSDSPHWPPSRKDLLKKYPSGTHEFLEKRAISGCWKQVAEDENDFALLDGDMDSFAEDITGGTDSIEQETEPESIMTANQCHIGKEVNSRADVLENKSIKRLRPRKPAVNKHRMTESEVAKVVTESDYITVDGFKDSNNINADAIEKPNGMFESEREIDSIIVKSGELDNHNIDPFGQLETTAQGVSMQLDNATDQTLGNFGNEKKVARESTMMGMLDTTEVDLSVPEHKVRDSDTPKVGSRVEIELRGDPLVETASTLYRVSQYPGWEMGNESRMTRQDGQQGCNSKMSTAIDPKELLERWDWVFQKK